LWSQISQAGQAGILDLLEVTAARFAKAAQNISTRVACIEREDIPKG
jgi:outer membrane cobalamin receptor